MATTSTDRRQGVNIGAAVKVPCKVATTANIALSGEQTVDGVALVSGDRCLVKNQTDGIENGIYEVSTSTWQRTKDWDGDSEVKKGTLVYAHSGTANSGWWYVSTADTITVGTTSVTISQASTALAVISPFAQTLLDDTTSDAFLTTLTILRTGAVARSVREALLEDHISVFEYMTAAEKADVLAWTFLLDVQPACQSAVDAAAALSTAANPNPRRVFFPAGGYRFDDTLKVGYGDGAYTCVELIGGMSYAGYTSTVKIDCSNFDDRPGINIQGARGVKISGFHLEGANVKPLTPTDRGGSPTNTEADYVTAGCTTGRYNPYCGISIDAYSGAAPGTPYTNDAYGRYNSSHVLIENCNIRHFVVAYMHKPSDETANAENVRYRNCQAEYNTYAWSIGNSQARNVVLDGCSAYGHRWTIACRSHGKQQGQTPFMYGLNAGGTWRLFDLAANAGQGYVAGGHFEEFVELVYSAVSVGPTIMPVTFDGCIFGMTDTNFASQGKISMIPVFAGGPVSFRGCYIWDGGAEYGVFNVCGSYQNTPVHFDTTHFGFPNAWDDYPYVGLSVDAEACFPTFTACKAATLEDPNSAHQLMLNTAGGYQTVGNRIQFTPFTRFHYSALGGTYALKSGAGNTYVGVTYVSHIWNTTTQVDVTVGAGLGAEVAVGDIVMWQSALIEGAYQYKVPALKVTAVVGDVVSMDALFHPDYYDSAWVPTALMIVPREWAAGVAFTADTTNASAVLANVSVDSLLKVRDFVKGTNIPANTRVVSMDTGANTVTLSKNCTGTTAGVSLTYGTKAAII